MKVCSIHWGFMPGGAANYAVYLDNLNALNSIELKTLCILSKDWSVDKVALSKLNVDIIYIRNRFDLTWIRKVRFFLKNFCPDKILTHGFNGAFVACVSSFMFKIDIYSSWHGLYYPSTLKQKIFEYPFKQLENLLYKFFVKKIVTVSKFSKDVLISKNIPESKITVIYNGIPDVLLNHFSRSLIRKDIGVSEDVFLVGTACRFASQKSLHFMIYAFKLVHLLCPDIRFVMWGEGPLLSDMKLLAKSLAVEECIIFAGHSNDVSSCLSALDVFVMSSKAEYFSIALLEAMRAELAIIASHVGGNPEAIVNGKEGLLVPYGDPKSMSDNIIRLKNDPVLRKILGTNARQRFLNNFKFDKMVEKTAEWLSC